MKAKRLFYAFALVCGVFGAQAAWLDRTAGSPWLQHFPAREMGMDNGQWFVAQDRLGRLFVGSNGLFVFDGLEWKRHAIGNAYAVRSLCFDGVGNRLWVGGSNEMGYVDEPAVGDFRYHSLIDKLPDTERSIGESWGVTRTGGSTYFVSREKLYRWDGQAFHISHFPTTARLFAFRFNDEMWFHHRETGLYRIAKDGPHLELPLSQLPEGVAIQGLTQTQNGLLLVTSHGFFRPGAPAQPEFGEATNRFVAENRMSCYLRLANGGHAVGTLGGLLLLSPTGEIQRILDGSHGLPATVIFSVSEDALGYLWCSTTDGIYRLEGRGQATLFDPRNGLSGSVSAISLEGERKSFGSLSGLYDLTPNHQHGASVVDTGVRGVTGINGIQLVPGGVLVGRHGGLDFYGSQKLTNVYSIPGWGILTVQRSRYTPDHYWVTESYGLTRLVSPAEGTFTHDRVARTTATPLGFVHEDPVGGTWFGTTGEGILVHDQKTGTTRSVLDPETSRAFVDQVAFENASGNFVFFADEKFLQGKPDGSDLRVLHKMPGLQSNLLCAAGTDDRFVLAFKRIAGSGSTVWGQGLGTLTLQPDGSARWQELEVPYLGTIGLAQTLAFSQEEGHRVLWLGGTQGLLRLDLDSLPAVSTPQPPFILPDYVNSTPPATADQLSFPFQDHRLAFRIFTGGLFPQQGLAAADPVGSRGRHLVAPHFPPCL